MAKVSFKAQVLRVREEAIISSVNRLLAEKGFDLMTVDEVAADVGIAKASLYRHFSSKEELAAAAMVRVLGRALEFAQSLRIPESGTPLERLKAVARWTMEVQWAGEMPALPSQNSSLRAALVANSDYLQKLDAVSELLGAWIVDAQTVGLLNPALPPELVLYTLFARACDPVLVLMKSTGQYSADQVIGMLLTTCFEGLGARSAPVQPQPTSDVARKLSALS
jgi:AcrR family transcriptional regulator